MVRLIAATLLLFTANSFASFYTGYEILNECKSARNGLCLGYIVAVVDLYNLYGDNYICIQDGVKLGQLKLLTINALEEKPDNLHYQPARIISTALHDAFPCTK
jgi:hypothetical protein